MGTTTTAAPCVAVAAEPPVRPLDGGGAAVGVVEAHTPEEWRRSRWDLGHSDGSAVVQQAGADVQREVNILIHVVVAAELYIAPAAGCTAAALLPPAA